MPDTDDAMVRSLTERTIAAVWRIESAKIVATLTRMTGDFGLAEDLAQEALVDALTQWPESGVPRNPAAWLTAVAKRKAIDGWRRQERLDDRIALLAHDLEREQADARDQEPWDPDAIDDDVLRLVFVACHPVLAREARVALTLRVVAGLSIEQIARVSGAGGHRAAAHRPCQADTRRRAHPVRSPGEAGVRRAAGHRVRRSLPDLQRGACRQQRPGLDASRPGRRGHPSRACAGGAGARGTRRPQPARADGAHRSPVSRPHRCARRPCAARRSGPHPVGPQPHRSGTCLARRSGRASRRAHGLRPSSGHRRTACDRRLRRGHRLGRDRRALRSARPDRPVTGRRTQQGRRGRHGHRTASALRIVDALAETGALRGYHLLPATRGELLLRLGRREEARAEFLTAARLAGNDRERALLEAKAAAQHS